MIQRPRDPAQSDEITVAPDFRPADQQPVWRQDFPIDWPQDQFVERRNFMKFLVLTSLAMTVGQVWVASRDWLRRRNGGLPVRRIASFDEIPIGGVVTFAYPTEHDPCVLVRLTDADFVAFSQKCTHLSCAVIPKPDRNVIYCPCHEGLFDLKSGRPIAGPPPRPLPRIQLDIRRREIFATGIDMGAS